MGAPKQKWTSEEEAALKAGIEKYGAGKWSTILKDPEFYVILRLRSNVDLKDKWRNMNSIMSSGSSSRRASGSKNSQLPPKHDGDATPIAASIETYQDSGSKKHISRLDDVIMEAISKLKEPRGSSRNTMLGYIEENYSAPPELDKALAARLKQLKENGQLIKVKHLYRIAPSSTLLNPTKDPPFLLTTEVDKKDSSEVHNSIINILTKSQIDADLEKMKNMTAEEAAAAAAQAVAEAEAAIEAAEMAAKEAEEAEAEAEAARCFALAARKAVFSKNTRFR